MYKVDHISKINSILFYKLYSILNCFSIYILLW